MRIGRRQHQHGVDAADRSSPLADIGRGRESQNFAPTARGLASRVSSGDRGDHAAPVAPGRASALACGSSALPSPMTAMPIMPDRFRERTRRGALRLRLQRQRQTGEHLLLRHDGMVAAGTPVDEVAIVGDRQRAAVHVARAVAVGDEHVIRAGAALDIEVLAQFQRAFGADHEQPAIAPGRQAVGREPVQPARSRAPTASSAPARRNPRIRQVRCRTRRSWLCRSPRRRRPRTPGTGRSNARRYH